MLVPHIFGGHWVTFSKSFATVRQSAWRVGSFTPEKNFSTDAPVSFVLFSAIDDLRYRPTPMAMLTAVIHVSGTMNTTASTGSGRGSRSPPRRPRWVLWLDIHVEVRRTPLHGL